MRSLLPTLLMTSSSMQYIEPLLAFVKRLLHAPTFFYRLGHTQLGRQLNRKGEGGQAPQQQRVVVLVLLVLCPLASAMGSTLAPLLSRQSLDQTPQGACQMSSCMGCESLAWGS